MKILIDNKRFTVNNLSIYLSYNVKELFVDNDKIFVFLDSPTGVKLTFIEINNILCFNEDGDTLWTVKNTPLKDLLQMKNMPFVGINLHDNYE